MYFTVHVKETYSHKVELPMAINPVCIILIVILQIVH